MCDVVEHALNFNSLSSNKLNQFASEAVGLLPTYNVNRIKREDNAHVQQPALAPPTPSGNSVLASSAGRAAGANWGRYEGGEMKKRWAAQVRAHGGRTVPQPGQQTQTPHQPGQPGQPGQPPMGSGQGTQQGPGMGQSNTMYGQGRGGPGVFNVSSPVQIPGQGPQASGQQGQIPQHPQQQPHQPRHPLLISEPDDVVDAPPRHWTLFSKHFLFAKDWTRGHEGLAEVPPGGRQRENFFYNKIVPSEEAVLIAAGPLRKAMGIETRSVSLAKKAGTSINFSIGSGSASALSANSPQPQAGFGGPGGPGHAGPQGQVHPTSGQGQSQGPIGGLMGMPGRAGPTSIKMEAGMAGAMTPSQTSPTMTGGFMGANTQGGMISTTIGPGSGASPGILGVPGPGGMQGPGGQVLQPSQAMMGPGQQGQAGAGQGAVHQMRFPRRTYSPMEGGSTMGLFSCFDQC